MHSLPPFLSLTLILLTGPLLAQSDEPDKGFVVPPRYRKLEDLRPEHFEPIQTPAGAALLEEELASQLGLDPRFRRRLLAMKEHLIQERKKSEEEAAAIVTPFLDALIEKWKAESGLGLKALVEIDTSLLARWKTSQTEVPALDKLISDLRRQRAEVESSLESAKGSPSPSPDTVGSLERQWHALSRRIDVARSSLDAHRSAMERLSFYSRIARDRITELLDDGQSGARGPGSERPETKIAERLDEAARHRRDGEPKKLLKELEGLLRLQPDYPPYKLLLIHLRASQGRLFNEQHARRLIKELVAVRVLERDRELSDTEMSQVLRKLTHGDHELSLEQMQRHAEQIERSLQNDEKLFFILDRWWMERRLRLLPREIASDRVILANLHAQMRRPHLGESNRLIILRDIQKVTARIEAQESELAQLQDLLDQHR